VRGHVGVLSHHSCLVMNKLFYSSSIDPENWHTPLHGHLDGVGVVKSFINENTKKLVCDGACWCGEVW
jgi:hypothetical protein